MRVNNKRAEILEHINRLIVNKFYIYFTLVVDRYDAFYATLLYKVE